MCKLRWSECVATEREILDHLHACEPAFVSRLLERVELADYAIKLRACAVTMEVWDQNSLVGLVAVYLNDTSERPVGFVTSVSVLEGYQGRGIAKAMLDKCHRRAAQFGFKSIRLEVSRNNIAALTLYNQLGYVTLHDGDGVIVMERLCGDIR